MKLKITLILSLVFIAVILKIVTFSKNFVENFYSRTIYKTIAGYLNKLSSNVSFSVGEVLLFVFIIAVILFIILALKHSFFNHNIASIKEKLKTALNFMYVFICFIVLIYIVFMLVWGLNYYRVPLIEYYANNSSITDDDIYNLADRLIRNVNDLKDEMKYTDINTNYQVLNRIVESEYNKVFEYFEFLNMHYSKTKPIKISKLFLHLQITGIYSPFTSEANVNILIPSVSIPFTIAHEMAHQIGIAYEDEDLKYLQKTELGLFDDNMPKELKLRFLTSHKGELMDCFSSVDVKVRDFVQNSFMKASTSTYVKFLPLRFSVIFSQDKAVIYLLKKD